MTTSLSVITICFNNLEELISTCASVDKQTIPPQEHLIIDGSSGTTINQWLKTTPQPSWRKWVFERDNGISDAFNKGINNCIGNLIHLLNSGDCFHDNDAIKTVINCFEKDASIMWIHSCYIQHRGQLDVISGVPFDKNQLWKGMRAVAHPTMFIKKEVYIRHGLYDTSLKITMDYDLLVRIRDEKFLFINKPLIRFAPGGASHSQFFLGLKEVKQCHKKYLGYSFRQTLWQLRQKMLNYFMQTLIGKKWFQLKNRNNKVLNTE